MLPRSLLTVAVLAALALAPPPAAAATLTPTEPPAISGVFREGGVVNATPGTWPGAEPTYRFQWQRCDADGELCTTITGRTQQAYTAVSSDVNHTLRVHVTGTSADGSGQATSAATVPITGIAPVNTTAPTIDGHPRSGQTLSADPKGWTGTQPIGFAFQWIGCDDRGQACAPLAGASGTTYALSPGDVGRRLQVRITATNAAGQSAIHSGLTPVIGVPAPPIPISPPVLSGAARDTQLLSAGRGTWGGAEPMTYAYRWLRCNVLAPDACAPVTGQVASTYRLTPADLGAVLRTEVAAANPDGNATQLSAPSGAVAPEPPQAAGAPTITGTPRVGQPLTGIKNLFTGTPEIEYAVQWRRCLEECTPIAGATTSSYRLVEADAGARIDFAVTATNAAGSATKASIPTRTISPAAPPRNTALPTITGAARDGAALLSTNGTWTGLSPRFAHQWLRCDSAGAGCAPITGATRSGYTLTPADVARTVRLRVTATNEDGTADATSAPTAAIVAIPPAPITPVVAGTASEGERLTATAGTWGGSPPVRLEHAWERCAADGSACATIAGADEPAYLLVPADIGFRIRARVTGTNAGGSVEARSALSARVEGTAPAPGETGPVVRGVPRDGVALTGDRGVWRGTAPVAYTLQWQRCNPSGGACAAIPGATAATYTPGAADHGATVRLRVEATNAYGTRTADSPATAVIAAAAPAMVTRPTVAGPREDGAMLTVAPGTWTGTAPLAFAYQWERADALTGAWNPIAGATAAEHRLTSADVGATLRVRVTVTNPASMPAVAYTATITGIAAVAPANSEPPAISGAARDGQLLTADPGEWTGTEPRTQRLQWLRCDAAGASCVLIDRAVGSTYRLVAADIGRSVRVQVSVSNAATAGGPPVQVRSERTPVVVPDPPSNRVAPTVLGVPRDGRILTAEPGEWSGTARIEYAYRWERCTTTLPLRCTTIDGASASTYTLRASEVGSTVRVQVTAANAGGAATVPSAVSAVVAGDPPRNVELPTLTGTPYDGELLTATSGRWTGAIPFTFDYRWARCDRLAVTCGEIPGAVASTYRVGSADMGYRIRLEVIARNSGGSTTAFAVPTAAASPRPPAFVTPPTVSGRPGVGQELTAHDGTHSGTAPLTISREWLRCDALGAACQPIAGATAPTYRLVPADLGRRVRLRVRVDNAARGTGVTWRTAATRVIRDDPPRILTPPQITSAGGLVAQGVALVASPGTWAGGPPMVRTLRWQRCTAAGAGCTDIAGAVEARYVPAAADLGARLRISVTMDNGVGAATAASAPTAVVGGAPPAVTTPPSITVRTDLKPGGELAAAPGTWTGAAPLAYEYAWLRCGADGSGCVPVAGAQTATHRLTDADVGRTLRVRVRAGNATAAVTATSAATGAVAPLAPALTGTIAVTLDGPRAQPGASLHGALGSWTGTAPVQLSARWQRCTSASACEDIPGADTVDYEIAEADYGKRLRLVVTARNVAATASAASVLGDLVAGSPPAAVRAPTVALEPGAALADGGVLRADRGAWTGTGPLVYGYQWQRCADGPDGPRCTPITGSTGATHLLAAADVGQRIAVLVTARGPGGRAEAASTPTEPVAAVAPAAGGPPEIDRPPGVLKVGSRLGARPGTWTGTAPIALEYQWLRCDGAGEECQPIDLATKSLLSLTARDFGEAGALAGTLRVAVTGRNKGGAVTLRSDPVGQGPVPVPAAPVKPAATPAPVKPVPTPAPVKPRTTTTTAPAKPKPPGTAPEDATVPVIRFPTARLDSRGRLSLRLACPAGAEPCAGRWTAAGPRISRSKSFTLAAGQARRWRLRLKPAARRAVRRAKRLTVTLAVTGQASRTRAVTVRMAAKRATPRR